MPTITDRISASGRRCMLAAPAYRALGIKCCIAAGRDYILALHRTYGLPEPADAELPPPPPWRRYDAGNGGSRSISRTCTACGSALAYAFC